ncbi:(2Fe-2S)-binding protein [Larsenimonas rhizosphaerae]|uniref:(2Fe-2S)-binding protein n=1 Tax=Larsenimonas rhizosphaerae TaxID=2944682 RepID=UPI0020347F7A|nr:(2Fe-2S)-binding protein [Larsenimonas rhizosphaerae]MCM2129607.1 (2Fe-2S)-binding protein [Larsenimonas rhizosphaerae]
MVDTTPATAVQHADPAATPRLHDVELTINGQTHHLSIEPNVVLLDALRERLGLTGAKKGCDHGQCGACTVLVDGRSMNSCLMLASMADGCDITTVEGLAKPDGTLHPVQQAFLEHDAYQCGYCTAGQMMSATAILNDPSIERTDASIKDAMSGNICRCGAYKNIHDAIKTADARLNGGE